MASLEDKISKFLPPFVIMVLYANAWFELCNEICFDNKTKNDKDEACQSLGVAACEVMP